MRILILNADYPRFLTWFYKNQPGLEHSSYATQMAARNASLFGVADFYSRNFAELGHTAAEIHVNNLWLQSAWAREHGVVLDPTPGPDWTRQRTLPNWLQRATKPFKPLLRPLAQRLGFSPRLGATARKILLAQVEHFRPDVVFNQDVFHVDAHLVRQIASIGNPMIIGQIGIEPTRGADWSSYHLMLSQLPSTVAHFRSMGNKSEVSHLAFEPTILDSLRPTACDIEVSFVGTISVDHQQRIALLEAVARHYDLKLWGHLPENFPASSPLHGCFQGEAWGKQMYEILQRSCITLNSHIDFTGREAGNMRLFEATGSGSFLLTDSKDNLKTLFTPHEEVGVWRSVDDCLDSIKRHLADDTARNQIAKAGQKRTLTEHTYRNRVRDILEFIAKR